MTTKERIVAEIERLPEQYLEELYCLIKEFEQKKETAIDSGESVMAQLRQIKISASPDFSTRVDLYNREEGNAQ